MGYLYDERETHLYYDPVDRKWECWTNIQSWKDKMVKCGWTVTDVGKVNGEEVDWTLTIDQKSAITIRDMTKPKRTISEEHAEKLRKGWEERQTNASDDEFILEASKHGQTIIGMDAHKTKTVLQ